MAAAVVFATVRALTCPPPPAPNEHPYPTGSTGP